jgi:acyl dehydratase
MSVVLPDEIAELVGRPMYPLTAEFPAEMGYGWNTLAATENGNPLYWEPAVAEMLTGGAILPLSTLSLWMRPHRWAPGATTEQVALQVHFDLKERLGLPEAIMSDNTIVFHEPVHPGDVITHHQVLKSVSGPKTTRLGSGRFWVIDVEYHNQDGTLVGVESYTGFGYRRDDASPAGQPEESSQAESPSPAEPSDPRAKPDPAHDQVRVGDVLPELIHDVTATTVVLGALASRDWRPMHHDYRFATERNGTRDIFLNTPNQLAWIERAITDWTGPKGRLGRISFRMQDPVFPGDRMTIAARVAANPIDETGCGWAELDLMLRGGDRLCTTGRARVALPMSSADNPWLRRGEDWQP